MVTFIDKLILGTAQLGLDYGVNNSFGKPARDEAFAILDAAWDTGIRRLDTAQAYGNAQEIIGLWHRQNPGRRFAVISKIAKTNTGRLGRDAIEVMVSTLEVDALWGVLLHSANTSIDDLGSLDSLQFLREQELTRHIGVSIYTNEEMETFSANPVVDLIQLPYNMLDNRQQRGSAICEACDRGTILHARSVFLQGLFFKSIATFPQSLQPLRHHVARLQSVARSNGLDIGAMALGYVLQHQAMSGVLFGVDNAAQLTENIAALGRGIPADVVQAIDEIAVQETALLNPSNW